MTLQVLLVAARFLHYAAVTALFGAALFPLYAFAGSRAEAEIVRVLKAVGVVSAAGALVTGAGWFLLSSAGMSGDLAAAFDLSALGFVAAETEFGRVWMVRGVLGAVALWAAMRASTPRLQAGLSAALLASIALTGHTQVESGAAGLLHVAADGLHLLGAGAWLGALIPLLVLAAADPHVARTRGLDLGLVLANFSAIGVAAVATLVLSGVVNAWFLVGGVEQLFTTPYGRVLCLKLALFGAMLALAAANRVWITAALNTGLMAEQARPWVKRLRHHVLAEQVLGILVLLAVAALGTLEPAGAGG
jgi:putative copper resistance protein D